jgi:hypothetical protein
VPQLDALAALFPFTAAAARARARTAAKAALFKALDGAERGVRTTSRRAVEAAVDALAATGPGGGALSGCWRLLWTSERETLFLLKNGVAFVGPAGESFQTIDTGAESLSNVILFGDEGAFTVSARLSVTSPTRCEFAFTGAALTVGQRRFSVQPVGAGTFESVYVDNELRVSRDSRGDTLVVTRCSAPARLRTL